jgi:hypothetical protein
VQAEKALYAAVVCSANVPLWYWRFVRRFTFFPVFPTVVQKSILLEQFDATRSRIELANGYQFAEYFQLRILQTAEIEFSLQITPF